MNNPNQPFEELFQLAEAYRWAVPRCPICYAYERKFTTTQIAYSPSNPPRFTDPDFYVLAHAQHYFEYQQLLNEITAFFTDRMLEANNDPDPQHICDLAKVELALSSPWAAKLADYKSHFNS